MPIIVSEIKIAPGEPKEKAFEKAFSVLKIKSSEANSVSVSKVSVDARKKDRVSLVFSVAVSCENEEKIAERAKAKGITEVVFDRGGYVYHGRVKELAEGAREGGLQF